MSETTRTRYKIQWHRTHLGADEWVDGPASQSRKRELNGPFRTEEDGLHALKLAKARSNIEQRLVRVVTTVTVVG
jgi:hypothetical protein